MDKSSKEKQNRQKNLDQYNSVTEKVKKPENQNQEHNARKEAVDVKCETGIRSGTKQRKASNGCLLRAKGRGMENEIAVAICSLVGTLVGSLAGIMTANRLD